MVSKNHRDNPMDASLSLITDFCFTVYGEKIKGEGEDSFYYGLANSVSCVSVFDGCGGSGARRYERLGGVTGAYLASRVVSGAARDWFLLTDMDDDANALARSLKARIERYLGICRAEAGEISRLRGSMSKELPTTCAIVVVRDNNGQQEALSIWAGDSRCYLLDAGGLHQLTADDLGGLDAMQNLASDGVLTNVISSSSPFDLHSKTTALSDPCLLFTATDGCFGYFPSPMHFEYMLVDALYDSSSPAEWEERIKNAMEGVSGDDFTLCGISLGFGSFAVMQKVLKPRRVELAKKYFSITDAAGRWLPEVAWKAYKAGYESHL